MSDPKKTKVVFMGTSSFAARILEGLLEKKYAIRAVYTQSPKKSGRDQETVESPVGKLSKNNKLETFSPESFTEEEISRLKSFSPDFIIVASYGKILPKSVLAIPASACLNVHASLLPKFRGPSPIQNALLEGENETGVTIMLMDEGIDTGDILSAKKISIAKDELFPSLLEKLSELGKDLLLETIPPFLEKKIKPEAQNKEQATLCQLIEREDGRILWSDEATEIYNRYRAFYSWPGIYSFWEKNGQAKRIKLKEIRILEGEVGTPKHLGEIFLSEKEELAIMAENGAIVVDKIQLEGKNTVSGKEFLNGYPDLIGSILK